MSSITAIIFSFIFIVFTLVSTSQAKVDFVTRRQILGNVPPANVIPVGQVKGVNTFLAIYTVGSHVVPAQAVPAEETAAYIGGVTKFYAYVTAQEPNFQAHWSETENADVPTYALNLAAEGEPPCYVGRVKIGNDTYLGQVSEERGGLFYLKNLQGFPAPDVATKYEVLHISSYIGTGVSTYVSRGPKDIPSNAIKAGFDAEGAVQYFTVAFDFLLRPGYHTEGKDGTYFVSNSAQMTDLIEYVTVDEGFTYEWTPYHARSDRAMIWDNYGVGRTKHMGFVDVVGYVKAGGMIYNYKQQSYNTLVNITVLDIIKL